MLLDTNRRDTTTELFGHKIRAPIVFLPIGVNKIYHPEGELPVAKVAGYRHQSFMLKCRRIELAILFEVEWP